MNAIRTIKRPKVNSPTTRDLILALLTVFGAHVSSMPDEIKGQDIYHDRWELFDPAKVRQDDELPSPWHKVYEMHMRPDMGDCRKLRYRYVHCPKKIYPGYPKIPCRGIFCLCDPSIRSDRLSEADLIFIGNEF